MAVPHLICVVLSFHLRELTKGFKLLVKRKQYFENH